MASRLAPELLHQIFSDLFEEYYDGPLRCGPSENHCRSGFVGDLVRCGGVCHAWRTAYKSFPRPIKVMGIDRLRAFHKALDSGEVEGSKVRWLELSAAWEVGEARTFGITGVIVHLPHLRHLQFSTFSETTPLADNLAHQRFFVSRMPIPLFPNLTSFRMGSNLRYRESESIICDMLRFMPNLRRLELGQVIASAEAVPNMWGVHKLFRRCITRISKPTFKLQHLTLDSGSFDFDDLDWLLESSRESLTSLSIANRDSLLFFTPGSNLSQPVPLSILPRITHLRLGDDVDPKPRFWQFVRPAEFVHLYWPSPVELLGFLTNVTELPSTLRLSHLDPIEVMNWMRACYTATFVDKVRSVKRIELRYHQMRVDRASSRGGAGDQVEDRWWIEERQRWWTARTAETREIEDLASVLGCKVEVFVDEMDFTRVERDF